MFKACSRQPRLLQNNLHGHRWLKITSLPLRTANGRRYRSTLSSPILSYSTNDKHHDDLLLRRVFDSESFWRDFKSASVNHAQQNVGLFQNRYLTEPSGFLRFARDIRERCEEVVGRIVHASTKDELVSVLQNFDLLSDYLCRVLDLADFVRATHPDSAFQKCATDAYVHLWEYMNILNTTPDLKNQLQNILAQTEITSRWNEEETRVAHNLMHDFSNSAINHPQAIRNRFVELSNQAKSLGSLFLEDMRPAQAYLRLKTRDVSGMDPIELKPHSSQFGNVMLPLGSGLAYNALSVIQSESTRRSIYSGMRTVSDRQIQTLEDLLHVRSDLAKLSDYPSYAEMNLSDKMAQSPHAVDSFLRALSADNVPFVTQEVQRLQVIKNADGYKEPLHAWDLMYYQSRLRSSSEPTARPEQDVSPYFSLGTVMQGLSRLFDRLYGVRFVPQKTGPGETWDPDVRRLNVIHESEGHLAVLYCDLYERAGKSANPTHFTLRCARQLSEAELLEDSLTSHDGMARSRPSSSGKIHQLPTIALICDFSRLDNSEVPSFLSFRDVQTLFHEMGHAIHSILGRTTYQVVSGTRCVTDFAELPSVLMERFAADEDVLSLFGRHWKTDAPLPFRLVKRTLDAQKQHLGMQTETQILYSLLDQAYHSPRVSAEDFDSTRTFYQIYDSFGSLPEPRGTSPQGFFGHLVEYGGTYYSYLFDRAIAGKIWRQVFRNGVDGGGIDRENGERLRNGVLKWGGAKDPWKCVAEVLEDDRLMEGGSSAMEQVGKWGVHS